ncbi:N-acyl homoserine lactonase family protein (plasmid) [Rhizobium sp. T1470]|uniref:N-acyl homoserine lactonase family protein n=1 Tax=unclassified Rhizobium TaxID=2613769 RepID=UPI001AAE91A9|nr:N-acyl homoserine lactonase family protein [Rhizobium sp. T1473]MCA0805196.1 N-acyl homoserine lactonase family protein [Rhizobium sp. T1473]
MIPFELFAVRYAYNGPRSRNQNELGGKVNEPHSALDYYFWIARRSDRVFMIDTGMSEETALRRGETYYRVPADTLELLGLDASKVEDIILTHVHYDHAGMLDRYPRAQFHVQDTEMSYATGRCMCSNLLRRGYEVDDVTHLIRCVYGNKVTFHNETVEIADGLSVHKVGGHTGGLQVVRVWTQRGWVVLASDASHLYCNMVKGTVFPSIYRVDEMMEAYRILNRLSGGSWDRVIPGHDPLVMELYPAPSTELKGIVARLDTEPLAPLPSF